MYNPLFDVGSDANDQNLVARASQGSYEALDELIKKHQRFIYNIALRMTGNTYDAEDVTQEILIKVITKLSSFDGRSLFSTWLYRIVTNHVLNQQRSQREVLFKDFETYRLLIDGAQNITISHSELTPDEEVLSNEARKECMMGMLLCLDRRQRLAFILGGIFAIDSVVGAEVMEMSRSNFRKILSRAREQLKCYMSGDCSLMNPSGTCQCVKKTGALIKAGYVNPSKLTFEQTHIERVKAFIDANIHKTQEDYVGEVDRLYQAHPYMSGPDFTKALKDRMTKMDANWQSI